MLRYGLAMRCGPAASLDQLQALFALRMLLANLTREDATAPPPAVSVPTGGACMASRWELPICVDVARAHGDWRTERTYLARFASSPAMISLRRQRGRRSVT